MLYSLYIDGKQVDLASNVDISLTYTSVDLSSPEAVKNSFSKSVELKGTLNNNRIFGSIYKLDRSTINDDDILTGINFDSRKRTPFVLYYNGEIVESGYFQLDEININNKAITYSITLYGELGNFFYNLQYDEGEDERKLYDLTFEDEEEFDDRSTNKWNADFILNGWYNLGLTNNDVNQSDAKLPTHIVAVPTYSGYYDDFDNEKVAVNLTDANSDISDILNNTTGADGSSHSNVGNINNWALITAPRDLDEWELKDLRCKYQRPAFKTSWVLEAISNPENNGGYTLDWDEDILNSPYYKDSWCLRNRLTSDTDDDLAAANYMEFDMGGNKILSYYGTVNTTGFAMMDTDGNTSFSYDSESSCFVNAFNIKIETPQLDKSSQFLTCWENALWEIGPYAYQFGPFGSRSVICVSGLEIHLTFQDVTRNSSITKTTFLYSCLKPGEYNYVQSTAMKNLLAYVESQYDSMQNLTLSKCDANHSQWFFNDVTYIDESNWADGDKIQVILGVVSKRYMATVDGENYTMLHYDSYDESINLDDYLFIDPVLGKRVFFGGIKLREGQTNKYIIRDDAKIRDNKSITVTNNTSYQSGVMTDYLNENNEFVLSKRKLFNNDDVTPFTFLTSFTKMLNLKYLPDIGTKTIHIMPFNKFYQNEIIDLSKDIDRGDTITITPNVAEHLYYKWQLSENENYVTDIIKDTYGINVGEYIKNTGYQFSRDTSEVMDDLIFKNTALYLQNSIFYSKIPLVSDPDNYPYNFPAILLSPTYTQTFYSTTNGDSVEVDKIGKGGNYNSPLYRKTDDVPKLCCFDSDNNEVDDLDLVLVYFDGIHDCSTNEYILSENIQTIIKMNDYNNLHIYSNSTDYLSDFTNDSGKIKFINQLPLFHKALNYKYLLDFNQPQYSFVSDANKYKETDNIYGRYWGNYIDDLYNVDNKKVELKCFLKNKPYDALRKFYWFDNSLWMLNEIDDYDVSSPEPVDCTFIKVNDIQSYIGNYVEVEEVTTSSEESTSSSEEEPTTIIEEPTTTVD